MEQSKQPIYPIIQDHDSYAGNSQIQTVIHFTNKEMGFQGNTDIIVHSTKHQWSKQLT